ncbi:MAG TPA: penicillin acylase family protein, partial [Longimicrobiales bacterium]
PGVWYLMALHAPDVDVVGMTLPGVPNVIAGHNKAVAWGFTNVMMDDVDFFIERADPRDPGRYQTPGGNAAFTVFAESLQVKGRSEPVRFSVRVSRHGPIISDVDSRLKGSELLAMQWAAADTSRSMQAFPRFNRARNALELANAVRDFDNPHQNVVYADTAGNFGYVMGGRIPLRGARRRPPILPVPGWTGQWDWHGYLPATLYPNESNPSKGYIVTANNRQARSEVADLISNDWELPYRAMRIEQMIVARRKHSASTVHHMQLDVVDLLALRYKDAAVRAARAAGRAEIGAQLTAWNGMAERASHAAAHFYVWYETLRRDVAATLYGHAGGNISRDVLNTALDSGRIGWLGDRGKTALDSLARVAVLASDSIVGDKSWGELHEVVIVHALAEVAALEKVFNLNVGPAPHRGSPTTVNVAQYVVHGYPIRTSYGPSERHVVDMADIDGAGGFILPAGESGLPNSEHYADMFGRWRNGGLWVIPLDREGANRRIVHRMIIKPR